MDLLRSLHVDALPEQQTRAVHLSDKLSANESGDLRLGLNCCCTCAGPFQPNRTVVCKHCQRVAYCSKACLELDADTSHLQEAEEALGHSSLLCSILRLCNDDEDVDDNKDVDGTSRDDTTRQKSNKKRSKGPDYDAARARVQSELESYPTTLGNILLECPVYDSVFGQNGHKRHAGTSTNNGKRTQNGERQVVIHLIGVSDDAELWNGRFDKACRAYGEALVSFVEKYRVSSVLLRMVGPECPDNHSPFESKFQLDSNPRQSYGLRITTHRGLYDTDLVSSTETPNAVVLFNPGFTCPDYDWSKTVRSFQQLSKRQHDRPVGFLITTNTEMECVADCQFLLDQELILSPPAVLAEVLDTKQDPSVEHTDMSEERSELDDTVVVFAENPYCGDRVRQSGTMANDVFIKNRWMLCGMLLGNKQDGTGQTDGTGEIRNTKRTKDERNGDNHDGPGGQTKQKKIKCNRALI